jgi:glycosyltransferase involved in cell wall biosynthesis
MPSSTFQHLAICLPAHCEAESLVSLLPELDASLGNLGVKRVTVFVFDDGSQDGTVEVVRSARMRHAEIFLIQSLVRVGKASGLHDCFTEALASGADAVVMMDADGQDDPAFIRSLLTQLKAGIDVVNGRRTNRAHGIGKRLSSRAFNAAVRLVSRKKVWDVNSGFKGFSRRGAEALIPYLYGELHRVVIVIALRLGLSVGEVPVLNRPRFAGTTKYGLARGWRGLLDLVTIRFLLRYRNRPGHFFSGVGLVLVALGALLSGLGFASSVTGGLFGFLVWGGVTLGGFGWMFVCFAFVSELMLFLSKAPVGSVTTVTRVTNRHAKV